VPALRVAITAALRRGQITALNLAAATVIAAGARNAALAVIVAAAAGLERFGGIKMAVFATVTARIVHYEVFLV